MNALDNPVWSTLVGHHSRFGARSGETSWFPSDIAPFVAVPSSVVVPNLDGALAGGMSESAYFVGVCPSELPRGWRYVAESQIVQMLPPPDFKHVGARSIVDLKVADWDKMHALAQLAFPLFFRRRTAALGLYLGIFSGQELAAMAGERMAFADLQEISGVCTHPAHLGHGHARALTLELLRRHRERGVRSFLHVSENNEAARGLYRSMGFSERTSLTMRRVEHAP